MTLFEVLSRLPEIPDESTIFAERIDGKFVSDSNAMLLTSTASGKPRGFEYFLEVSVASEVIEGWTENHHGQAPSLSDALETIIFYAENDAYPNSFFG